MKSFLAIIVLVAAASTAGAQTAIAPPQVGYLYDGSASFRAVFGIGGNFLLGAPAVTAASSAAYSGSYGLVKTATSIVVTNNQGRPLASMDAPSGPALFAFGSDGSPAFAYLPAEHLLFEWCGTAFQMLPFNSLLFPTGAVRAIFAPDAAHAGFLVQRLDGLWDIRVLVETGEVDSESVLAGVSGPALMLSTGELIYTDRDGVIVRHADRSQVHIGGPIPIHSTFAQMGAGWIDLADMDTGAHYAVRVTTGRESFYCLPQIQQKEAAR